MTAARYTWAIYVLFHVCVIFCAHGGELREGVLTGWFGMTHADTVY